MELNGKSRIETLATKTCVNSEGQLMNVFERRHFIVSRTEAGERRYVGARFWCTADGRQVRLIDSSMFELTATGDLLVVVE